MTQWLNDEFNIKATTTNDDANATITLARTTDITKSEAYKLTVTQSQIVIEASDAPGIYYATQTLRQAITKHADSFFIPCLTIEDYPALPDRSMHYDTKHHQGTYQYVQNFIKDLAYYKVNIIVWEWEDKLAYETHPEIGAPGAFTIKEMQQLTAFAKQHHIEITPLVQGLGHVSYILKHPQHHHLREIHDSNWQFCPLKQGTYDLLFDLFDDAIKATPNSKYIHIGSDETYELAQGIECGCAQKAAEIGRDGLMQLFIQKCVKHCESKGRTVISWGGEWQPNQKHQPLKSMIFVDSGDPEYLKQAHQAGYSVWVYAQNPGIEPLFLPLFPWVQRTEYSHNGSAMSGSNRQGVIQSAINMAVPARQGSVSGSISTTWDDSGPHHQCNMPRLIAGAEFSWNTEERTVDQWADTFFKSYFSPKSTDLRELFMTMFESAHFYYQTLQRAVWHNYNLGKMYLPDFPRDELEYNNYWRVQHEKLIANAKLELLSVNRQLDIIDNNLAIKPRHAHDLEIYRVCVNLMKHNVQLFLMLANLEEALALASDKYHYSDNAKALQALRAAEQLIRDHLTNRDAVYNQLVAVYEQTRLPKDLSLPDKKFFHAPDRPRHFANRTPDMSYLIMDEQLLDLETYLEKLIDYNNQYEKTHVKNQH